MASRYSLHPHIWQRLSRGPLGPSADALVALLVEQGYCPHRIAAVRAALAVHCVTQFGRSVAETARQLGVSTAGIAKAVARAEQP
jgi:hypothetical protein